ncbi:glycerol-3-phosphate dehydrogenase [Ammoniphilus oxalaticus]|uniref:Glycerol-3-phosphate dehydrogenase n=1 Tax=Ammoniphilus oxalaticus TaxID=66863 RepID=A0A419SFT5_9BACL|nr:FAD-dependent oxidoreductase [Ammoniphilus oxalaticus]RKD22640.1 glycerol-3-phosphate dehydrogenase [Ammoniphilus oxalaticus]
MTRSFSTLNRTSIVKGIAGNSVDLLIIGGGITGAGIALDAAARGMKTVLFEMQDFSAGTSSRSTKLAHGGLRYLQQWELKLVAETGRERAVVYENGPHVTRPEWMLTPIYKGAAIGKRSVAIGLKLYDFLAGVKRAERRKMLSKEEVLKFVPFLKSSDLLGAGFYVEYRTDDARLTIETLKESTRQGATALNYSKVERLLYEAGKVNGVEVKDQVSGEWYQVFAKKVVNATGPWVDEVRKLDHDDGREKTLRLTKGIHLVIDQATFPLRQAVYFESLDGRMMFAIPRDGKTYVGTTDTDYDDDLIQPRMTIADRDYVLDAIQNQFPGLSIKVEDVESSWAGLRPLIQEEGKAPSEVSRKDEVWQSRSGLISIAGGKLTGYRKMAERVVDKVVQDLQKKRERTYSKCRSRRLPISGGDVGGSAGFDDYIQNKVKQGTAFGFTAIQAERLVRRYGSNVDDLFKLASEYRAKIDIPLDWFVEVLYGIRYEMVVTPTDFFIRRTGALSFQIETVSRWKFAVIRIMADQLGWTADQKLKYLVDLDKRLHEAVEPLDETL